MASCLGWRRHKGGFVLFRTDYVTLDFFRSGRADQELVLKVQVIDDCGIKRITSSAK